MAKWLYILLQCGMKAIIISIGDELVTGHIVDTNTAWLAKRIFDLGYEVISHHTVGDNCSLISELITQAAGQCDLIVATGGLGPTPDDITREAAAHVVNESLVDDPQALVIMKQRYEKRGITMPPENFIQAQRPESATMIPNDCGTAPGLILQIGNKATLYVLPGVPDEMRAMWETSVESALISGDGDINRQISHVELVQCIGMPESKVGYKLKDLMQRGIQPVVGTLPKDSLVTCRVYGRGDADEDIVNQVKSVADVIVERLGPFVFGRGEISLPESIVARLAEAGKKCVTVESCTGGMLGAMITQAAGASGVYVGGWQTYSNQMKIDEVAVKQGIIDKYGAVSDVVAKQMAMGAVHKSGADIAISITGIAGPDGGTETKPVGTVYIALAALIPDDNKTDQQMEPVIVKRFLYPGDRATVRKRAVTSAMAMLHLHLVNNGIIPRLTWESQLEISD